MFRLLLVFVAGRFLSGLFLFVMFMDSTQQCRLIEVVLTEHRITDHQHRHPAAEGLFERIVVIDITPFDGDAIALYIRG